MIDTPREVDYLMTTFDNKRNSFVNRHQSLRMCSLLGHQCAAILSYVHTVNNEIRLAFLHARASAVIFACGSFNVV